MMSTTVRARGVVLLQTSSFQQLRYAFVRRHQFKLITQASGFTINRARTRRLLGIHQMAGLFRFLIFSSEHCY